MVLQFRLLIHGQCDIDTSIPIQLFGKPPITEILLDLLNSVANLTIIAVAFALPTGPFNQLTHEITPSRFVKGEL